MAEYKYSRNRNKYYGGGQEGRYPEGRRSYGDERYSGYGGGYSRSDSEEGSWSNPYAKNPDTDQHRYDEGGYSSRSFDRDREYDSDYRSQSSDYQYPGNRRRNLYDRDYEGIGRREYSQGGTRFGGANYGGYGDRGRFDGDRHYGGNRGGYYGSGYGRKYSSYGSGDEGERSWWDRTTDEISSWFGDEDAQRRREWDRNHRGKGPKNYTRSDERIREDISDRLSDDPFIDATEIEVSVTNGEVTLMGSVDDRHSKRRAEDLTEVVSGVRHVENRLRVNQNTGYRNPENERHTTSAVPGSDRERTKKDYMTG